MNRRGKLLLYGAGGILVVTLLWVGIRAGSVHFEKGSQEKQTLQAESSLQPPDERTDPKANALSSTERTEPNASVQPPGDRSPSLPEATPAPSPQQQQAQPQTAPSYKTEPESVPQAGNEASGTKSNREIPKASYEDIIGRTESSLQAMEGEAANYFFQTAAQYLQAKDADEKNRLKREAQGKMAQFDARFNGMMKTLEMELRENGYDTSKVQEYRSAYQAEKAAGQSQLEGLKN